jgi:hypothetical protein
MQSDVLANLMNGLNLTLMVLHHSTRAEVALLCV